MGGSSPHWISQSSANAPLDQLESWIVSKAMGSTIRYTTSIVFVIRADGEQIDNPRSPADFEASDLTDGSWHVIRADYPFDA